MTSDPTENSIFAIFCQDSVVLQKFLNEIWVNIKAVDRLQTWHGIWKDYKIHFFWASDHIYRKQKDIIIQLWRCLFYQVIEHIQYCLNGPQKLQLCYLL